MCLCTNVAFASSFNTFTLLRMISNVQDLTFICIFTSISIHTSIHPYIHVSIYPYLHICIYPCIHISPYLYISTSLHVYISISLYIYMISIRVSICLCVFLSIWNVCIWHLRLWIFALRMTNRSLQSCELLRVPSFGKIWAAQLPSTP